MPTKTELRALTAIAGWEPIPCVRGAKVVNLYVWPGDVVAVSDTDKGCEILIHKGGTASKFYSELSAVAVWQRLCGWMAHLGSPAFLEDMNQKGLQGVARLVSATLADHFERNTTEIVRDVLKAEMDERLDAALKRYTDQAQKAKTNMAKPDKRGR